MPKLLLATKKQNVNEAWKLANGFYNHYGPDVATPFIVIFDNGDRKRVRANRARGKEDQAQYFIMMNRQAEMITIDKIEELLEANGEEL